MKFANYFFKNIVNSAAPEDKKRDMQKILEAS